MDALQTASGQDVHAWANAWVLQRGMPEVHTEWTCSHGRLGTLTFTQRSVLNSNDLWPMSMNVLLVPAEGDSRTVRIDWPKGPTGWSMYDRHDLPCPRYVFANAGDEAYGRFLLDAQSESVVQDDLLQPDTIHDALLKSMLWGALWDNVHIAQSAPRGYVRLALKDLPHQNDETLARLQYGRVNGALQRYITGPVRGPLVAQLESTATDRMLHASTIGLRLVAFRALSAAAETPAARATLKGMLAGTVTLPDVELRPLDRWNIVGRLIAVGDADAPTLLAAEARRDTSDDGRRSAWAVQAGAPDAATKRNYFAAYLVPPKSPDTKQEDWLSQSLAPFNNVRQSALTLPYVRQSLDQLPEIKRDRKIFYLGVWLSAFLGGQTTPQAEAIVREWLAQPGIDPDLRRKVLENMDPLTRTVRIRQRFPE